MKVVFFGTPDWAVRSLRALGRAGQTIVGVVTAPDRPVGRSRRPQPSPVKSDCDRIGLSPVLQPVSLRGAENRRQILELEPDVLVVVAYGRILPGRILDATRLGAVNVHFSLLPRHRGASPVQHTILCGDEMAGVSTMRMDRGLDTGPILLQQGHAVDHADTTDSLGDRLADAGASLLIETLELLASGTLAGRPQDDALATIAPKLDQTAGLVRWSSGAGQIARMTRAFSRWPPVVARGPRGRLRLLRASALDEAGPPAVPPGTVIRREGEAVDVVSGDRRLLRIEELQPENRARMTAASALAGRYIELGGMLADGMEP